ncbi:DUF2062 domain-containing protein [Nitratireductor sp. StC3]|nr:MULTISPECIES: DUF2062 domain-containing protein [Nitratireductor]PSM17162.1 DUF2062 domain-containing protein [Nitratireductor sp. StC3]
MLFRRRKPADMWERTRTFVWPRRSFWRSAQYYVKRVLRLNATPHAIAAGIASGVFVSFLPFLGFHFVFAAVFAWLLAGNLLASAIGTAIGNPITFPLIWASTFEFGSFLLGSGQPGASATIHFGRMLRHLEFSQLWDPLLKPMTAGGIPLGMAFALGFYLVTRWGVAAFRRQRQRRLAERAMRRAVRPADGAVARG